MAPKKKAAEEYKAPDAPKATRVPPKEAAMLGMIGYDFECQFKTIVCCWEA